MKKKTSEERYRDGKRNANETSLFYYMYIHINLTF